MRPLVEERKKNGGYKSLDDFCRRAGGPGVNRRTLESMIKAGAFDSLGPRGAMLSALDQIVATAQREAQSRSSGQSSLFGNDLGASIQEAPGIILASNDASPEEKAGWERELLGVALSHNPLMALSNAAAGSGNAIVALDRITEEMQGQSVTVLGIISTVTERARRDGQRFYIVALDLLGGQLEVIIWPESLQRTEDVWHPARTVRVAGKVRMRGDQAELVCDEAEEYAPDRPSTLSATSTPPARGNGNGAAAKAKAGGNGNGNGNGSGNGRAAAKSSNGNGNGNGSAAAKSNGNGGANGNGNGNGNGHGHAGGNGGAAAPAPPGNAARLLQLVVTETDDPHHDAMLLREVIGVILEYPGRDRVNLDIRSPGRRVLLDMPVVSTGYCEPLNRRLEELLGADTVTVSHEMPLGV